LFNRYRFSRRIPHAVCLALIGIGCLWFIGCRSTVHSVDISDPISADSSPAVTSADGVPEITPADWPLTLINDAHPLTAEYIPALGQVTDSEKQLEIHAAQAMNRLLADARKANVPCFLVSGYRSVDYQRELFRRKVQSYLDRGFAPAEAEQQAAGWVARPGTSEHALGLAADLVSNDWYLTHSDLTEDFDTTEQFRWLCEHGADYGFILRYPKEKEDITGVHYEPWHWRWVGNTAAQIAQSGLCLEEWLSRCSQ